jgi:hypothetical protein
MLVIWRPANWLLSSIWTVVDLREWFVYRFESPALLLMVGIIFPIALWPTGALVHQLTGLSPLLGRWRKRLHFGFKCLLYMIKDLTGHRGSSENINKMKFKNTQVIWYFVSKNNKIGKQIMDGEMIFMSWRSVLLVVETGEPGENHRAAASTKSQQVAIFSSSFFFVFCLFFFLLFF